MARSLSSMYRHITLSIVIPVFNNTNFVRIMIESILANDFDDWELLAVDDGSDELTISLLQSYTNADSRVHLIQRTCTPKGAQTCRNIGMEKAQGKYIVFFDSDDYITPSCLRQRVEAIKLQCDKDFLVFPSGHIVNGTHFAKPYVYSFGYKTHNSDLTSFFRRELPFVVCNNIYNLESLRKHHLMWDTQLLSMQDAAFNISALCKGLSYNYIVCEPDYYYRIDSSPNSISKKLMTESHRQSILYYFNKEIELVREYYGQRYNRYIYYGMLKLSFTLFEKHLDIDYARSLSKVLMQKSRFWGLLFRYQYELCNCFQFILPLSLARKFVFFPYLLESLWRNHKQIKRKNKIKLKTI